METLRQAQGSAIRSFVAIELPPEVKTALTDIQRQLMSRQQPWMKWVAPDGVHLTLKFLGNVAADMVPQIVDALTPPARSASPLHLKLAEVGGFPNMRSPRVVWVGLAGDIEALAMLQLDVEAALEKLGFAPEGRAFSPHLTLGRVRESATPLDRQELGQLLAQRQVETDVGFVATEISLMRSQLTPAGAIYSRLANIALGDTLPESI